MTSQGGPGTLGVGILGATGTVGSLLVRLIEGHPWFRLVEVGASPSSAGRRLGDCSPEDHFGPLGAAGDLVLKALDADWKAPLLLSALPSTAALQAEPLLAGRGHLVVSNASAFRQDPDVPLVIPEVNPDHLGLLRRQSGRWPGGIVTNPNCVTAGLATALAPLHRAFGLETVVVTTMQAISGAGRPGPAAGELTDNIIPFIADEEDKIALESQRILGELSGERIEPAAFAVSAHANRVPVLHGHLMTVSARLRRRAPVEEVARSLAGFEGAHESRKLPSAPDRLIEVLEGRARPQPRLDRDRASGMSVTVGRLRECPALDFRFLVLVHNLLRGAAGAALLNAELCHAVGATDRKPVA